MVSEFYVYQLRRSDQDYPFYIGKGKSTRAWDHLTEAPTKRLNHMKHSVIKKARDSKVEILVEFINENLTEDIALRMEVWAIKMWGRLSLGEGPLTNLTDGGEGGQTLSDPEVKNRFTKSMEIANAKPETKINRTNAAKKMWLDNSFRQKMRLAKQTSYLENPTQKIHKRINGWNRSEEKWMLAEIIYNFWIDNNKPTYKFIERLLVKNGYPQFHLQKMIEYFKIVNITTDPVYINWVKSKNIGE